MGSIATSSSNRRCPATVLVVVVLIMSVVHVAIASSEQGAATTDPASWTEWAKEKISDSTGAAKDKAQEMANEAGTAGGWAKEKAQHTPATAGGCAEEEAQESVVAANAKQTLESAKQKSEQLLNDDHRHVADDEL